jgi:acyl carrier protein
MTFEALVAVIAEVAEVDPSTVEPGTILADELDIDSLALIEVATIIEQRGGASLFDEELTGVRTAGDLAARLQGQRRTTS